MWLIDRHIFGAWFRAFLLSVGAVLGILLLEDVFSNLQDLMGYGASGREIARYYVVLLPSLLPAVLPLALMVSLLFSLGNLHRDNEIIALRACGLGLGRITRTLWAAGIIIAVVVFYLNARWTPWSVEQSRTMWDNYRFAHQLELAPDSTEGVGLLHNLTFHNLAENRIWFLNRFSEYDYRAFGVTISQLDDTGREIRRLIANEGHYDEYDRAWTLLRVREITFAPETGDAIRSRVIERHVYEELQENPQLMQFLEKRPRDLSFLEIAQILEMAPLDENPRVLPYVVRYYATMASPLASLFAVAIAIPFAVRGVRVNPMVNVSKSIGLFFAYYVLASVCTLLGEKGIILPQLAATLPLLLVIPVLVWLYRPSV